MYYTVIKHDGNLRTREKCLKCFITAQYMVTGLAFLCALTDRFNARETIKHGFLNLVPRVSLLPAKSERKRPWLRLVACPESGRLQINDSSV